MSRSRRVSVFLLIYTVFFAGPANGQHKMDTLNVLDRMKINSQSSFLNNIVNDLLESIQRSSADTGSETVRVEKSEDRFKPFQGKHIRNIRVEQYGFERKIADTASRVNYLGAKFLNTLHTDTREKVIRENLFIKKKAPLNASELADNERYLRTLEFIQDARILIEPLPDNPDSVDVLVITKDLFSLTGAAYIPGTQLIELTAADVNLAGMGQKVQATGLWEKKRNPELGYEILYSKTNIKGSFLNGTIAYNSINTGRSEGSEEEQGLAFRLHRPLVSPFSHVAGGLEVSFNQSINVYQKPPSTFYDYHYNFYDFWLGYNLGTNRFTIYENLGLDRNRAFVALRYFWADFKRTPHQIGAAFDPIYNDRKAILGQITFFRQDFYKFNYIYGFGATEDIPSGYSISATVGWHRQIKRDRPYAGIQSEFFHVTPAGGFLNTTFKTGGFYRAGDMEDFSLLGSVHYFTPLFKFRRLKLRHFFKSSYSRIENRKTMEQLRLNTPYGLHHFETDSVYGRQRLSLYMESVLFSNRQFLGFRFAPFVFGEGALITPEKRGFLKSDLYTGLGAGIRTRNENLVFGTIELRAIYFPRTEENVSAFQLLLSSDLKYRYKTRFIHPPDIIRLNDDGY